MKIPKIKWIPFDSNNPPANLNPDENKSPKKILYLCDGGQCETCSNECNHTTDIDHAKNFNKEFGVYVEKENNYAENQ